MIVLMAWARPCFLLLRLILKAILKKVWLTVHSFCISGQNKVQKQLCILGVYPIINEMEMDGSKMEDISIKANGETIFQMEKEFKNSKMVIFFKAILSKGRNTEKEHIFGSMDSMKNIKGSLNLIKCVETEY